MGMTVKMVYESAHIAMGAMIPYAIELRISIRKMTRPAKKRKTDRWRRAGRTSTTADRRNLSAPSAKNARMRARACGE